VIFESVGARNHNDLWLLDKVNNKKTLGVMPSNILLVSVSKGVLSVVGDLDLCLKAY
jgi:hypothetical protein